MKDILLDINIVVDLSTERQPNFSSSLEVITQAKKRGQRVWLYAGNMQMYLRISMLELQTQEKYRTDEDPSKKARELLERFSQDKQWLAAIAEDCNVFNDSDPETAQLYNAVQRLGPDARIVCRENKLIERGDYAITVEEYLSQEVKPQIDFIDLKIQQDQNRPELERNIYKVLYHGKYIMGAEVVDLEEKLANYVGTKHCIAVSSGTDALLIALMALGVGAGDEVITTAFSFIATAETIALLGAIPIFVDIDPHTYNIEPGKIEAAITKKTRAIMPVSLYGQCADFDAINAIADKYQLPVIEDGAQSLGATYKGNQSCGLSTIGCTSFFPSKPLGCYGDGGACFTDDDLMAKIMREIRVHGQERRYYHSRIGINGRLDTLQAAILLAKLKKFPAEVEARARIGQCYTEALQDFFTTPYIAPYNTSVYAQYTIQVDNRDERVKQLKAQGIPTAVHYPVPLNRQPAFTLNNQYANTSFPVAEKIAERVMSLPMHPYLTEAEKIAKTLKIVSWMKDSQS